MKLRIWVYFFRQAFMNIMNNRMVHAIGMGTIVISLLILGTFFLFFVNLNNWIHGWGHSLTLSVYLHEGIDQKTTDTIAASIRKFPSAEIKRYISKEDALKELKTALGTEAGLLDGLMKNPLPASFEVVLKEIESPEKDLRKMKKSLEQISGVDEVQYSEEWLERFKGLMNWVKLIGFIIGGLLCMGVLFIVTNTIKLTIYSRKYEIEIQKLVGATNWFVKAPYLLEGLIQGIFSGAFSLLALFSGYLFLASRRVHFLGLTVLDFVFLPREYTLFILLLSMTLGLAGSFIAVGRFLAAETFVDL